MPELPEVEAARHQLQRWTAGASVVGVAGDGAKTLVGAAILAWERRGKQLAARLIDGSWWMLHFGMTGRVALDPPAERRHVRASWQLSNGHVVAFIDTRRLGATRHAPAGTDPFAGLGPDALDVLHRGNASETLAERLGTGSHGGILKDRALDQQRLAGIGNIAILEGCWRASIHPHTPVGAITADGWARLATGLRDHLDATLAGCLAEPDFLYVSEGGANPFAIYGRDGAACPRCGDGHRLTRTVRQGRPTVACLHCQPLPTA
jgi:formamidopyrimidine-DNA glycosylase